MIAVKFYTRDEFSAKEDERIRLATERGTGVAMAEALGLGAMWECPWYYDPNDEDQERRARRDNALKGIADGTFGLRQTYLSAHYWKDWSDKRPPLCVICPDRSVWCIDARSSNGSGWTVTGTPPKITCIPSILVKGYHGFLQEGVFTPDIDGRKY
jgi:hypothetical protein